MSVSIKTVLDENIHRFTLPKPSFEELERALSSIYGKNVFSIRYSDEDGDMISVSSTMELQEALRVAGGKTLKLILSRVDNEKDASFVCVDEAKRQKEQAAREQAEAEARAQDEQRARDAAARAEELAEAEARAREEEEARVRAEVEAKRVEAEAEAARARAEAEAEARAREEEETRARAEAEAKRVEAEAEAARARAEAEAKAHAEAEERARVEAEAKAAADAKLLAEAQKDLEVAQKELEVAAEAAKRAKAAAAAAFWEAEEAREKAEKDARDREEAKLAKEQAKENEVKRKEEEKASREEIRALALQLLQDPEVQQILPELGQLVLRKVVEEARECKDDDRTESASRILSLITNHRVLAKKPAMDTLASRYLYRVRPCLARLLASLPPVLIELLDKLKDGLCINAQTLLSWASKPICVGNDMELDLGSFDLASLGVKMADLSPLLDALNGLPGCPVELGLKQVPSEPASNVHSTVRCDGCNVFPIVGTRYQCTVCNDFDLCEKCEASNVHPIEHPLLKHRQTASNVTIHHGVTCDNCNQSPIKGARFKCKICPDFDLCETCESKDVHPADHPMYKLRMEKGRTPRAQWMGRRFCFRRGPLVQGACGPRVKKLQEALGVAVDGYFGPKTEEAVKQFQAKHGLKVDGVVGPITRSALEEPTPQAPAAVSTPQVYAEPVTVHLPGVELLLNMGFSDVGAMNRLLTKHNGDVQAVVAEMLGQL